MGYPNVFYCSTRRIFFPSLFGFSATTFTNYPKVLT